LQKDLTSTNTPNQVEQRFLAEDTDLDTAELVAHNLLSACRERRLLEIQDTHRSSQQAPVGEEQNDDATRERRADGDHIVTAFSDLLFPTTPTSSAHLDHHHARGIIMSSNVMISPQRADDADSCILPLDLTMSVGIHPDSSSTTTQLPEFPPRPELTTLDLTGKLSGSPPDDHPSLPQLGF
jgi:hypothetical protein